ncbi:MAG: c-type cytochrome [Actinomycetota bacterium]|nr:c-type cytochrome [Actinomycetota bacterium]
MAAVSAAAFALLAVVVAGRGPDASAQVQPQPQKPRPEARSAEHLFKRDCAYCHGPRGEGTSRGPSLEESGTAAVHFYLTTGYMPISERDDPTRRREPAYAEDEIDALVRYTARFTRGPPIPRVEVDPEEIAHGGELYRLHCAACHQFAGAGGALIGLEQSPRLFDATPVEVVEALRIGPGPMPAFSEEQISEEDANAIASFVALELQQPTDAGGISLGHFGPYSEGAIAWLFGLGALLVAAAWIGRRT